MFGLLCLYIYIFLEMETSSKVQVLMSQKLSMSQSAMNAAEPLEPTQSIEVVLTDSGSLSERLLP